MAWADVKKEMTEEKGLDPAAADKIGEYVKHKGMCLSGLLAAYGVLTSTQAALSCLIF